GLDDRAHVVNPEAILRNDPAQQTLIRTLPLSNRPLKIRQVLFGDAHRLGLVRHWNIDNAIRRLHGHRANLFRSEDTEPTTFDHRRTTHANGGVGGSNDNVTAAKQCRIPGKATSRVNTDQRDEAAEPAKMVEGPNIETARTRPVYITRPAAASFGEN